jgi:peroxiredoxin
MIPELRPNRLQELQNQFTQLEPDIPDGATKQALSLLHAMLQESLRVGYTAENGGGGSHVASKLQQLLDYHKSAPAMDGPAENKGLPVGSEAPDFSLPDANGRPVTLSDFRGKPVVLVFYPLDWSPACSDQLSLYQSELDEFKKHGAVVLAVSVDSIYSHGAWSMLRGLEFPLLADFHPKGAVAKQYKVLRESDGFSERALFIIDGYGLIQYAHVSPELSHIPDIYELFDTLEELTRPAIEEVPVR